MNLLDFISKRIFKSLTTCLSVLFLLNIMISFSASPTHIKKTDDQNIVFLDINPGINILIDNTKPEKRIFNKTTGLEDIRNYFDNSLNIVFNKYHASIKNSLSKSISSHPFITVLYSTDI